MHLILSSALLAGTIFHSQLLEILLVSIGSIATSIQVRKFWLISKDPVRATWTIHSTYWHKQESIPEPIHILI